MATNSIKLLTGNSYPELARLVADRYGPFLTQTNQLRFSAFKPAPALQCDSALEIIVLGTFASLIGTVSTLLVRRSKEISIEIVGLTSDPTNTYQARNRAHQDPGTAIFEPGDFRYHWGVGQRRRWYALCSKACWAMSSLPYYSLHTAIHSTR